MSAGTATISERSRKGPRTEKTGVHLTKRELEVLLLIIKGKSSQDAANTLYVSVTTVSFHLANVYDKLRVSNRFQALHRATEMGLI